MRLRDEAGGGRRNQAGRSLLGSPPARLWLCAGLLLARVGALAAQAEVTRAPAERYEAAPLKSSLLGDDYRDLWQTPIRIPVLDLQRFAGGLTPLRMGGGRQTTSMRFLGRDGREYAFRSVDKRPALAQEEDLAGSLVGDLIQDQVSSLVPAAPLLGAAMARAAGVLHSSPRLFVMPDDPVLGEFRETFAGMVGTIEEHADELEDGTEGFGGFEVIAGTETLLEHLSEDPRHRVDSRAYLTARLLDLVIGDWDRHADQWRWARETVGNGYRWIPIARDRDYVASNYDGLLLHAARRAAPNAVRFDEEYRDLEGLVLNARDLDRRILGDLDRQAWASAAAALAARLTDAAIADAVAALPAEFVERRGAELTRILRARRDRLPEAAAAFYTSIARVPHIHGTDAHEHAGIHRNADGSVAVTIVGMTGDSPGTYYSRTLHPAETEEIRIFLGGGDDHAVVTGRTGRGIVVRVIGGAGADVLVDSSGVALAGSWTSLHDSDPGDALLGHSRTALDRRVYDPPEAGPRGLVRITPDDIGGSFSVRPSVDYSTTRGLVLGGSLRRTELGFRRLPYRSRLALDLRYAPRWSAFGIRGELDYRHADPAMRTRMEVSASEIETFRFYGFGNETDDELPSERYLVRRRRIVGEVSVLREIWAGIEVGIGGVATSRTFRAAEGGPLDELGVSGGRVGNAGGRLTVARREPAGEEVGPTLEGDLAVSYYPRVSGPSDAFGNAGGLVWGRVPFSSGSLSLAAAIGGRHSWGDYPIDEAAYLGGRQTLRGFPEGRFAGDSMVHGSIEARARLGRLPLLMNWRVDGFVFADAGRVFFSGEASDAWHAAPGAGLAFSALEVDFTLTYAQGPSPRVYLGVGTR